MGKGKPSRGLWNELNVAIVYKAKVFVKRIYNM